MISPLWKEIPFRYPKLLRFFEEISAIPRESHHEEKIADYLVAFALERGLPYYRDELQNVLIEKAGTKGYENHAPLLLQGHTDMVCEKNADVVHDFSCDPLDLYVEDGWLRARGTTLGADDGVAVAIMLSVLDGDVAAHPPIQCLFTSAEEVGMGGIESFDFSRVHAKKMINLDSPDDLQIIAGCAGGLYCTTQIKADAVPTKKPCLRLAISGLCGGHSGEDIHRSLANANVLLGRILLAISQATSLSLISVNGGNKENAIPREAEATVSVDSIDAARCAVDMWRSLIRAELSEADAGFSLTVTEGSVNAPLAMSEADTARVLLALTKLPCGVLSYNRMLGNIVDLSCNLGVVRTYTENGQYCVALSTLARSSDEARLSLLETEIQLLSKAIGAETVRDSFYSGWAFSEHSEIREAFAAACEAVVKQTPTITVIHAGLECGTVKKRIPTMDIISCGPQVRALHSPDEALNLASFEHFFAIMEYLLEHL